MDIQMTAEWNDIRADGTSTRYREGILYRGVDEDTAHRAIDAGRATEVDAVYGPVVPFVGDDGYGG